MRTLSTGEPSTLANWRKWAVTMFGDDSPAVAYLSRQITLEGENAEVVTDETLLLKLLCAMHDEKQLY